MRRNTDSDRPRNFRSSASSCANAFTTWTPTPREQELCSFWRRWEFELLRPTLVVAVGGLSIKWLLGRARTLDAAVGERFEVDGRAVVPLPHPSGRSTWLNDRANHARLTRAVELIRAELATLD